PHVLHERGARAQGGSGAPDSRHTGCARGRCGLRHDRSSRGAARGVKLRAVPAVGARTGDTRAPRLHDRVSAVTGDLMRLSARNIIPGKVQKVTRGATTSHVTLEVGGGVSITASITNEAVDDLQLKAGDQAYAVIKASDVMVAKD